MAVTPNMAGARIPALSWACALLLSAACAREPAAPPPTSPPPAAPPAAPAPAPAPPPVAPEPAPPAAPPSPAAAPAPEPGAAPTPDPAAADEAAAPEDGEQAAAAPTGDVARWIHRGSDGKPLSERFAKEIADAHAEGRQVIVMFTADWCSPCKSIKEFVRESAVVQRALAKGRMIYIDVDEWRGPAHQLIPGINPTKLPTMVRVDAAGHMVVTCYGSELGLLSEDAIATNLGRLAAGQPPAPPFYADKPELERELIRKQSDAQQARTAGQPELEATIVAQDGDKTKISLVIRNHEGPRRWYAFAEGRATAKGATTALTEAPAVATWQQVRFGEHVRADFVRLLPKDPRQSPPIAVVPVAGYGNVELQGWTLAGRWKAGDTLEVWQLNRLEFDGQPHQFQMKLPYHLPIKNASVQAVQATQTAAQVALHKAKALTAVLK